MTTADIVILGGGIAGVSLAAELAGHARVVLIEVEAQTGWHTTGRSAALYFESYGNDEIRALTRASRAFFTEPPAGFVDAPLLHARAAMFVANVDQQARLKEHCAENQALNAISCDEALRRVPILDPAWMAAAALDESGFDIDVAGLMQGYLAQARTRGVATMLGAGSTTIRRNASTWTVGTERGAAIETPVIVNAAGAWADGVAIAAGVPALGLTPLRRTAMILPAPEHQSVMDWPFVIDADETIYFKPDGGQILLSPANEDLDIPHDVTADELDVAIAIDRFERVTSMSVRRVMHRWAGLRTFAPDRTPVVGFDAHCAGFFWLAGQGGYGIQTAPAMSRLAAALVLDQPIPHDISEEGIGPGALCPQRAALAQS